MLLAQMIRGVAMKNQYIGDINDYRKYTLLQRLSEHTDLHLGVCWMLTADDGGSDGNKRQYLSQPQRWRHFNPALYDELITLLSSDHSPTIEQIEALSSLHSFTYFNANITDGLTERKTYMAQALQRLGDCDIVFFDPDNGLNVSIKKGNKNSSKYLYRDETLAFYSTGKSLLIYQHYPRISRPLFEQSIASELKDLCAASTIHIITSHHVAFFLILNPKHPELNTAIYRLKAHINDAMFSIRPIITDN